MAFDYTDVEESQALKDIRAVKEILSNSNRWTTGVRASAEGSHCMLGALDVVCEATGREADCNSYAKDAIAALARVVPSDFRKVATEPLMSDIYTIIHYNNTGDHARIKAWLDKAIAAEAAKQLVSK